MKQQQIVNAYKVIKKYENEKLPLDISYGLFKLKKLLQPQWDFEVDQEKIIFEKYNPTYDKSGNMTFSSEEDEEKFVKDLAELLDMEVDWDEKKIHIDFKDRMELPIVDIEVLDDFVTF